MQSKRLTSVIVAGILLLAAILFITTYNMLVKKEEQVNKQWAEMQNVYQRRLDLIPNLVNVVKGVSDFESSTLENVANARTKAINGTSGLSPTPENYEKQEQLQDSVAASANRIIAVIEDYPVLKGTAAYAGLQTQLEGTERRVKVARNDFNAAVADYNKRRRSFPANFIGGFLGFEVKEGFAAVAGSDKVVEIKF